MVETVVHRGGCHCGKVRYRVTAPDEVTVIECNCSICTKRGSRAFMVPAADFQLEGSSEEWLTTYTFNTHEAKHTFCKVCGISSHYIPRELLETVAVVVHCVDPGTIKEVKIRPFDGRSWE